MTKADIVNEIAKTTGYIDRLWPRGLSHETFHYDWWDKEIAPLSSAPSQFVSFRLADLMTLFMKSVLA